MLRLSRSALVTFLLAWGCAKAPAGDSTSSDPVPVAGNKGGASTSGSAGKSGGSGGSTASSSAASSCVPAISNLVTGNKWVCDMNTDLKIQGSFYSFGDGSSCTTTSDFCSASGGCCMAGATVVDSTYAKWGCGLGLELNASGGSSSVKSAYAGPVTCFDITLTGDSGGNEVRIGFTQAANTTGKVSPFVPLAPFTNGVQKKICLTDAECPDWAIKAGTCSKTVGTAGTPYDLQIQIPGGDKAGSFNVCVTKIVPITGGSVNTGTTTSTTTTNSCSSATGQGTLTTQYQRAHVTCNGKDYIVQNNAWGSSAGQTITYGPGTKFKVTVQNGSGTSAPASYPSIFVGDNGGGKTTDSSLPKQVSALGTVQTAWTWAANGASGDYNAAYDVWFSTSSAGDSSSSSPSGGYLMVWYYKPSSKSPIGKIVEGAAPVAGKKWNVWYGVNSSNNKPCVSYVAEQSLNSLSFDLNVFIKDAITRGYVQNSWSLTNVFAGFEIWSGGVGLETTDFAVTVN
jgi:hypothetical protein